jgi:type III secretion HrpO family protein
MNEAALIDLTARALTLVLVLSMPPILAATLIGILVSLVQALTQVQEQTLGFAVKLVVVSAVLILTMTWVGNEMLRFTDYIFNLIQTIRSPGVR